MNLEQDYYELLGIGKYASIDEIKSAFRDRAKEFHPDSNSGKADSVKFQKIRAAYETLSDPNLRREYNKSIREALVKKKNDEIQEIIFTLDTPTKLEIILAWSTTRPTFRTSFASSCLNNLAEGRILTNKQEEAIDNLILSFQIDLKLWLDEELRNEALEEYIKKEQRKQQEYESYANEFFTKKEETPTKKPFKNIFGD